MHSIRFDSIPPADGLFVMDWTAVLDAGDIPFNQLRDDQETAVKRIESAIIAAGGRNTAVGAALTKALRRKRPQESALKVLGQFRQKPRDMPERTVMEEAERPILHPAARWPQAVLLHGLSDAEGVTLPPPQTSPLDASTCDVDTTTASARGQKRLEQIIEIVHSEATTM